MSEMLNAVPSLLLEPKAFACKMIEIEPLWIDYNSHLNMAYYNVLFDRSLNEFVDMLGLGWRYMKERSKSSVAAECHVRYLREVKLHDPVHVTVLIIAADEKRIHYFLELRHTVEGWLAATSENMTLHIDMTVRRVAPYPPDVWARVKAVAEAHAKVPRPAGVGRSITMALS